MMFKDAVSFTVAVALGVAALFGLSYLGWASYNYFAPKYRATDNAVFKESEQYNDGMIRDLENLQMEYVKADDAHKAILRDITIHRFEVYDTNRLPPNLFNFYTQLKASQ
jgi:hypothetical protein